MEVVLICNSDRSNLRGGKKVTCLWSPRRLVVREGIYKEVRNHRSSFLPTIIISGVAEVKAAAATIWKVVADETEFAWKKQSRVTFGIPVDLT